MASFSDATGGKEEGRRREGGGKEAVGRLVMTRKKDVSPNHQ
jgi:hypothetical protein